ncbi:MAG TPA: hypothetical protein VG674_33160 [Amycolatopsis sp.]|nr:hypothetical protein [Amycolatopsis sp.]
MAPNYDNSAYDQTSSQAPSTQPPSTQPPSTQAPAAAVPLGNNSASDSIVASARSRAGGFEMGGDRAIANPPNWNSQASQQLYNGAVNDNDPGTAEATGQHWAHHGTQLKTASDDLYNAIGELGNAWVGEGAAGAQGVLVAIANSGAQASDAAHTMSDRLAKQAAAAAEVKKMPAPLDYDPKQSMAAALAGGPAAMAADQKAQADAANDVKAQQVAFFNAYTEAMKEVDSSTPSFGPDSLGMKATPTHFNGNDFAPAGAHHGPGDLGAGSGGGAYGIGAGFGGAGGAGSSAPAAHVTADSGTYGTSGYNGGLAAAAGTGAGAAPAPAAPAAPAAGSGIGSALGASALGGGLGFAGAKLGQGARSGSRTEEEQTSASAEHQGDQHAAPAPQQQQGVVSAGGTIGGQQPTPSMGGMGGMRGAGQGQEDEVHTHASFLIEPDPDDAFGANEATPPPVIGAWSDDDDN